MNMPTKDERESAAVLEILNTISTQHNVTQRHLADSLGVALGLANSYLKRCVKKGFVKIQQAPANRYLYYVTPQGFAEKSRLTAEYLSYSFDFYRRASADMTHALETCLADGATTVLFAGISELAEIGSIRAQEMGVHLQGTYAPGAKVKRFVGKPVWEDLTDVGEIQACILTSLGPSEDLFAELVNSLGSDWVYVPEIVKPLATSAA